MAGKTELSLEIKAFDSITAPLRKITAKLKELTTPIQTLGKDFGNFSKAAGFGKLAEGFGGVGGAVKNVAGEAFALGAKLLGLAAAAGYAFATMVRGAVDAGDKLAEMSDRVGVSADFYASLQYAAAQADVEQEAFNGAMDQFNKRLGEAKAGGGSLLTFLEKVSPRLAEQVKGAKNSEAALSLMTDAFTRINDPAKRAALSAEAFGKSGLQFGNFLHQGSAAIQAQQVEYLRLAGSQEAFAKGSSDLDNVLRDTETAFAGLRAAAAVGLYPAITKIAKAVTDFAVKNRAGLAKWATDTGNAISKWIDGGGLTRLTEQLGETARALSKAVDTVGGLQNVFIAIGVVMAGPLLSSIAALVPAVYGLGVALLTTPVGWFLLAVGAIAGAAYLLYENWDSIGPLLGKTFAGLVKLFAGLSTVVAGLLTFDVATIVDGWTLAFDGLRESVSSLVALLDKSPAFKQLLNGLTFNTFAAARGSFLGEELTSGTRNSLNVTRPGGPPGGASQSTAKVTVDFANAPRGTRVTADPSNTTPVTLNTGVSMAAP